MIIMRSGIEQSRRLPDFAEEDCTVRAVTIQNEHKSDKSIC